MTTQHTKTVFSRTLKLGPAIGDWTTIDPNERGIEEAKITQIKYPHFDGLPQTEVKYLHYLHYRLFEQILNKFSSDLELKIELHSITATQFSAQDFKDYLDAECTQAQLKIRGVGTVHMLLTNGLSNLLVNRLVGGGDTETQKISDLDLVVLEVALSACVNELSKSWKQIFSTEHVDVALRTGAFKFDERVSPRDSYMMFAAYFTMGNSDTLQQLIFTYPTTLTRKLLFFKRKQSDPLKKRVNIYTKTQKKISIPLFATLGETELSMNDLKNLQVGDIITLHSKITDPVELRIGEVKLYAQPGFIDGKRCVQVIGTDPNVLTEGVVQQHDEPQALVTHQPADIPTTPRTRPELSVAIPNLQAPIEKSVSNVAPAPMQTTPSDYAMPAPQNEPESPIASSAAVAQDELPPIEKDIPDFFKEHHESDATSPSVSYASDAPIALSQQSPQATTGVLASTDASAAAMNDEEIDQFMDNLDDHELESLARDLNVSGEVKDDLLDDDAGSPTVTASEDDFSWDDLDK